MPTSSGPRLRSFSQSPSSTAGADTELPTAADPSPTVVVNRWRDFVDRVGWTAAQAAGGVLLSWLESGRVVVWQALLQAAAIAALKVVVAQNVGNHNDGSAIPGGVLKQPSTAQGSHGKR